MNLREISSVFLRLGTLGFGGPLATMAMMEQETSRKRAWVSPAQFSEIYALCKILPGPVATQMAIYLGFVRGGTAGGIVSGGLFILPSFLAVLLFSFLYTHFGMVQKAGPLFAAMQAGALVVILTSTLNLAKPYRGSRQARWVALFAAIVVGMRPSLEPLVIVAAGLVGIGLATAAERRISTTLRSVVPVPMLATFVGAGAGALGAPIAESTLAKLFWVCFKAGAFVFGTGLAIVPLLEADTVTRHGWLTHSAFMDGLAIGQVTPGPVTITSTFIGYQTAGWIGALVATTGMFLPAFINVLVFVPRLWRRFSGTPQARGFAQWAIPAVIGGILGTMIRLGVVVLVGPATLVAFAAAALIAWRLKPPAWALIPASGVVGALAAALL
jgi:chromate transporter